MFLQGGAEYQQIAFCAGRRHRRALGGHQVHPVPEQQADAADAGLAGRQRKDPHVRQLLPRRLQLRRNVYFAHVRGAREEDCEQRFKGTSIVCTSP